jgi:antitoxin VapB
MVEAMALNLKNADVERLATEVARLTGESKTEAIRRALEERRQRLKGPSSAKRRARVLAYLRSRVWPSIPAAQRGRRLTRAEEDEILGYGSEGA